MSLLHKKHEFSDIFLKFVLLRGVRTREDLIDQLFNNSEKRLARTLLIMAEFGQPGEPESMIPPVTQEELAEMIGTTRSRVSKFMNNFRKLRYIDYRGGGRIHVHKALLNVVLHDGGQDAMGQPRLRTIEAVESLLSRVAEDTQFVVPTGDAAQPWR